MHTEIFDPDTWTVAQAKAKFSELIDKARRQGPQAITRNGKSAVVVVEASQWEQLQARKRQGSFTDFLLTSSLRGSKLKVTRLSAGIRKIE